jgi:NadR type nicotinamide-nucleotide adenylyltransferase
MTINIGLTLGKFLPLHKGHELLLKVAAANCDLLIVLIGTTPLDPFTFEQRASWVKQAVGTKAVIISQPELDKSAAKDEFGTITDESYWSRWLADTKIRIGSHFSYLTHVFTSDLYGKRIAEEFGINWVPIDPGREMISTSGTTIRNDFYSSFSFLPNYTRADLIQVAAIIGPESCGKSSMVSRLATHYDTLPEYGRIMSVNKENELDREDFRIIQKTQNFLIEELKHKAVHPIIISDTEALVTALYSDIWFTGKDNSEFYNFAEHQKLNKYIVLAPTVPWIQDGYRIMSDNYERQTFFNKLVNYLDKWKRDYEVITSENYFTRQTQVEKILQKMIPTPKF